MIKDYDSYLLETFSFTKLMLFLFSQSLRNERCSLCIYELSLGLSYF